MTIIGQIAMQPAPLTTYCGAKAGASRGNLNPCGADEHFAHLSPWKMSARTTGALNYGVATSAGINKFALGDPTPVTKS